MWLMLRAGVAVAAPPLNVLDFAAQDFVGPTLPLSLFVLLRVRLLPPPQLKPLSSAGLPQLVQLGGARTGIIRAHMLLLAAVLLILILILLLVRR